MTNYKLVPQRFSGLKNTIKQLHLPGFGDHSPQQSGEPKGFSKEKRVFILDTHFLMYQFFHAIPDIRGPSGQPIAAVHGFLNDVARLIDEQDADYVFCAFDCTLCENFRRSLHPEYKSNREEMPEDLKVQLLTVRRVLAAMNLPVLESPTFEADDILATVAKQAERKGDLCFLVTGDKDCRQLISERIKLFNIRKNELFDSNSLAEVWGIRADQVVDFQILVGDSVDNIPGIPLIGKKTAQSLLLKFGSLENLLANAECIPGIRLRDNLIAARKTVQVTRQLVSLVDNAPLNIEWETSLIGELDHQQLQDLCRDLGLNRLADRLRLRARIR